MREDDTWIWREDDALENIKRSNIICLLINLKWMKDDSSGGRIERRIELGMRFGREKDKDEHKNTVAISNQENISFQ